MRRILLTVSILPALVAGNAGADPMQSARPVACSTPHKLYEFLDAVELRDQQQQARLLRDACRVLGRISYTVEGSENGVTRIRIFQRPDDWETSVAAYTLDEMVDPAVLEQ
jgi:hypothetical protein